MSEIEVIGPAYEEEIRHEIHDGGHADHHGGSSLKSLIAGGMGGTLEVLTDHPIDLVKVRIQTAKTQKKKGVFSTLSDILKLEGFSGLYRGASIRVATLMPACAVSFWGLDVGKQIVVEYEKYSGIRRIRKSKDDFSVAEITVAGAFSGFPVTLIATPSERIKCLLQIQQKQQQAVASSSSAVVQYTGPLDCAQQTFAHGGIPSLYRGLGITLMRNIPGYAAWFGCYEYCKQSIMTYQGLDYQHARASIPTIIASGGTAGSFSWLIMIPFDGIKSRIQTTPDHVPVSIVGTFRELTARHGLSALFRGWKPAVLIAFPANAACFLGMELGWSLLTALDNSRT